jgi:YVTN family beta-propeller protein
VIPVGLHPSALSWDEPRGQLYVANSNSDSISVIDTKTDAVKRTIPIQPFSMKLSGIAPNAVAVTGDGKTLYVACGGINAIAVVRLNGGELEGLIPTGWYPTDLRISSDGKYLAVANLMGVGPGGSAEEIQRLARRANLRVDPGPTRRYVHSDRSSIQVIPVPDAAPLAGYTTAVAENNHLPLPFSNTHVVRNSTPKAALPVPLRAGDPSLIEHVVFIIKENRTYDQIFGDLSQGNSDSSLLVYGPGVTPNHHRLAEQFVLLDNFYATGGNSADGHQWVTQSAETDYCYWPGFTGRSYPFDGSDPIAPASSGFIWDAALARKRTVLNFGEYVAIPGDHLMLSERSKMLSEWKDGVDASGGFNITAPLVSVNQTIARDFPYWTLAVPDVVRAQIFLRHLQAWEKNGQMPNLVLVQLACDHTAGTVPGVSTPKAMVADNDLALGQIVERLSHSRFWKNMAIFVVEDDAQDGIDHVDGHRTVALAVSPYTRRRSVDSTFYSQTSMLKTIELMLGLPTLSLFDLIANDMRNSFQASADLTPYTAVPPKQSLFDVNPPVGVLKGSARKAAVTSARMNFSVPDTAPSEVLNRILWNDAKGWNWPYPTVRHSIFGFYSAGGEGDEKERREQEKK